VKNLLIGLIILFALLGILFYTNMFHTACVISFTLALFAGAFFTRYLSKQNEKRLLEQENLRKRLTADMAHELRTPLAAVAAHLEAMADGIWEPSADRLNGCREEILRITALVRDLQELARIDGANLKLSRSETDLLELAATVAKNFEAETAKKKLTVSVGGDACQVSADKDRVSQVLTNLISNAVSYTPDAGHICITTKSDGAGGVIEVCDDGIGIEPEELPFIFERFYRADKSRNRRTGGAGIGLAIAKSIVDAHKGTIGVSSEPGKGTRFIVTLPKR
jgi:signal transduction histidine kinase